MLTAGHIRAEDSQIRDARSVPIVPLVAESVALKRSGYGFFGLCPFHADVATASLHVTPDKGFHCFGCGAGGDAVSWVMRRDGVSFAEAVRRLTDHAFRPAPRTSWLDKLPHRKTYDKRKRTYLARKIWDEARPLTEPSPATLYLKTRRIWWERPSLALRYHPGLWCAEAMGRLPALVAAIEDDSGLVAVQRIWVAQRLELVNGEGPPDSRADVQRRKTTLGAMGSGAVRLAPPAATLGLAEGVETGLAAMLLFQIPTWAVCGAQRLTKVALPECVRRVVILADSGESGERAAEEARWHWSERLEDAATVYPPPPAKDWNDLVKARR